MDTRKQTTLSPERRRARGRAAFTLVEVVLAVVIAIGILVVALFFYQQSSSFRGQLLEETERISTVRLLMDRITAELRTAHNLDSFQKPLTGESNFIQFVRTDLPALADWTGGPMGRSASPETDLKVISYRLDVTDGTNIAGLLRSEEPLVGARTIIPDTNGMVETNRPANSAALPVSQAIRFVQFRYWDGSAWLEAWNSSYLPKGVEVNLGFEMPEPEVETNSLPAEVFRRIVYLPGSETGGQSLLSSNVLSDLGEAMEVEP